MRKSRFTEEQVREHEGILAISGVTAVMSFTGKAAGASEAPQMRGEIAKSFRLFEIRIFAPCAYFASSKIIAAPFSAIIAVGVLVLPDVIVGITEASATRSPAMP